MIGEQHAAFRLKHTHRHTVSFVRQVISRSLAHVGVGVNHCLNRQRVAAELALLHRDPVGNEEDEQGAWRQQESH